MPSTTRPSATAVGIWATATGGAGAGNTYTSVVNNGDGRGERHRLDTATAIGSRHCRRHRDQLRRRGELRLGLCLRLPATSPSRIGVSVDPTYGSLEQYGDIYALCAGLHLR
jgi:hypothetical protein